MEEEQAPPTVEALMDRLRATPLSALSPVMAEFLECLRQMRHAQFEAVYQLLLLEFQWGVAQGGVTEQFLTAVNKEDLLTRVALALEPPPPTPPPVEEAPARAPSPAKPTAPRPLVKGDLILDGIGGSGVPGMPTKPGSSSSHGVRSLPPHDPWSPWEVFIGNDTASVRVEMAGLARYKCTACTQDRNNCDHIRAIKAFLHASFGKRSLF